MPASVNTLKKSHMQKKTYQFALKKVTYYFDADFSQLGKIADKGSAIVITDDNIFGNYSKKLAGWKTIVINAGEGFKKQSTVDSIIAQLIAFEADRKTMLIGMGGGVVTDITGYVAAIYMRGIKFGFIPTSVLAMVDAAIGGKNGIDVGVYKNMVGTIRQPEFLLYDISLLKSLPETEWINGFAEIIKHACIRDEKLFKELEKNKIGFYQTNKVALSKLIRTNAVIKSEIVRKDEFENGERKLLNFGHTIGHAIENVYDLPHGQAISIGMVAACILSEQFSNFKDTGRIISLLSKYGLPTLAEFNAKKAFEVLKMDKKKVQQKLNYVLLNKIGEGFVKAIPIDQLEKLIHSIVRAR
jgi:3-dehydroquinate synthase